jgi:glycosyltransferase involved in cell wall biosynthesis
VLRFIGRIVLGHSFGIQDVNISDHKHVNLCLASPVFFPTYGGSQLRFLRYIPGLTKRNIDIRIVTGTPTAQDVTADQGNEAWAASPIGAILPAQNLNGVPVTRVRLPDKGGLRRGFYYLRTVARLCRTQPPDVLQLVGTLRFNAVPWLIRLRAMGIPSVYSVTITSKLSDNSKASIRHRLSMRRARNRALFNSLDCIIVNNSIMRTLMEDAGVRTRIEVIGNGVDLQRFHPADRLGEAMQLRNTLGIAQDEFMITTVGAVMPRKGSDILLAAWIRLLKNIPETHLVYVGPRKDLEHPDLKAFSARITDLANSSGAREHVHFVGLVDNVESYLQASDLFVLPSHREGLPNSVLEAMACGAPVVITPFLGLSTDLGRSDEHYLLADFSPDSLAEKMQSVLQSPELGKRLSRLGLQWIEQTMDLNRSLDRYADLYRELARKRR